MIGIFKPNYSKIRIHDMAATFNSLRFPLHGSRLIEASAGTGKTYTIAAFYVRLVLGHGGEEYAYSRSLTPPEILVVTYTDAATKELRDRIRVRLNQAANYFLLDPDTITTLIPHDDFLDNLRADYPPELWLTCARKLQLAAACMDVAAVSTIHSWCNHMLREYAFSSGNLFNPTLETNQNILLTEVARDYWRTFIVPLNADAVATMRGYNLCAPQLLLKKIKNLINQVELLANDDDPSIDLSPSKFSKLLNDHHNPEPLLRHATRWIVRRFADEQHRQARMGFNDLLTRLDAALQDVHNSSLVEDIRRQFPVAMIDEFQDIDPVQYRIFDTIYRVAANDPQIALIFIGDPKQAIYAFRGADIYTYLAARHACDQRRYTLKENFRSTTAMVAATNRCFEVAELRASGFGAFSFRNATANPVPFITADAHGLTNNLHIKQTPQSALTMWILQGAKLNKGAYRQQMAEVCAREIVHLLNLGHDGQANFVGAAMQRDLRPADLAVLVNSRSEAEAIRATLNKRGVRSVYLSDKDSVFQCPQAFDLQHWLAACAEPNNSQLIRTALATATLDLSWLELDNLNHDEFIWEAWVLKFRSYYECWHQQGVLPMLRRLLNDFQVPTRLLRQSSEGERILTNVLHLAELLQQTSMLLDGEHALIRYLAEQRQSKEYPSQNDTDKIRLESDADLVRIVTVHKSKGLDYPLVFIPFACNYHAITKKELPWKWHDPHGQAHLALNGEIKSIQQTADHERLGEDLRKLYVALTRARYATWIGVAPIAQLERSALGYLLSGGQIIIPTATTLKRQLETWCAPCTHIAVVPVSATTDDHYFPDHRSHTPPGAARTAHRMIRESWWITSYSALNTESSRVPDTATEDVFQEAFVDHRLTMNTLMPPSNNQMTGTLHDFLRGAEAGTFLHELLEGAAHQGFSHLTEHPEILHDMIANRCKLRNWAYWIEPLTTWLQNLLVTPLHLPTMNGVTTISFSLASLKSYSAEMEFWIAADNVDIRQLDNLIGNHTLDQAARPALTSGQINGIFKGFIDLVFEYHGRYYVIDYKSHWLGADNAAYTTAAMGSKILHARYEVQYVLYLFALHRLLTARLPNYHYEQHIGGAVAIFLRGSSAPGQGIHVERPPHELFKKLDALFSNTSPDI